MVFFLTIIVPRLDSVRVVGMMVPKLMSPWVSDAISASGSAASAVACMSGSRVKKTEPQSILALAFCAALASRSRFGRNVKPSMKMPRAKTETFSIWDAIILSLMLPSFVSLLSGLSWFIESSLVCVSS